MIEIIRYTKDKAEEWNEFNKKSKNSLFMFDRKYMEYHEDRFKDHSLMFYKDGELIALLPLSEDEKILTSHGGLTYGGFITNDKMKQHTMNDCFDELMTYSRNNDIKAIDYKTIPHFYHSQPAEEDRYALFINNANVVKIEASTVVDLKNPLKMPKGRKAQISRAKRESVLIKTLDNSSDFMSFIELENEVLGTYHETKAVHTGEELALLHSYFPENIKLYGALKDDKLIAGTVLFEYDNVIHTQYMAANEEAREIGALDYTIATVIANYKDKKKWLDFGISTENKGKKLNEGLISQKEGFGGRTNVYTTFRLEVKND